jgi:5-carboxymethyl-2-hydroxymuconate isomerase
MAQVKIYGHQTALNAIKPQLSQAIHACIVEALQYPPNKCFQRFFALAADDFIHPADRSEQYTIIEISLFTGRTVETKKTLIRLLFERLALLGINAQDLEITLFESECHNWGIRGLPGDELTLNYNVAV